MTERKAHLEDLLFNLGKEHNNLRSHFGQVIMTDGRLANIEEFCAKIRKGLDYVDFNSKRQIIELLDIKGKIAFENGERVLHLKCLITFQEQQPVLRIPISRSSNSGTIVTEKFAVVTCFLYNFRIHKQGINKNRIKNRTISAISKLGEPVILMALTPVISPR